MEWKTLILNSHERVGFDYLPWFALNSEFSAIKVLNYKVATCQRFEKSDVFLYQKISSFSLK